MSTEEIRKILSAERSRKETDSNWSVIFSVWDWLATTLRAAMDERCLTIGTPGRPLAASPTCALPTVRDQHVEARR